MQCLVDNKQNTLLDLDKKTNKLINWRNYFVEIKKNFFFFSANISHDLFTQYNGEKKTKKNMRYFSKQ